MSEADPSSTPDMPPGPASSRPVRLPLAVALAYRDGDSAPKVVAKGRGAIAQTIIERARAAGVYVHESKELVSLLMQVDLDQRIPPQLYIAVAELLAWLYRLERGDSTGVPGTHPPVPASAAAMINALPGLPGGPPPGAAPSVRSKASVR